MSDTKELVGNTENKIDKTRKIPVVIPLVDVFENEEEILLCAEMPGVVKEDINVNLDNGKLDISGSRTMGKNQGTTTWEEFGDIEYRRRFSVPQSIDVERVSAELKDGVLNLHLPKSEAAKPRQIEIKAA